MDLCKSRATDATAEVAKRVAEQDVVMLRETFDPEQIHPFQSQGQTPDGMVAMLGIRIF